MKSELTVPLVQLVPWRAPAECEPPEALRPWLLEADSMTRRLRRYNHHLSVQLLGNRAVSLTVEDYIARNGERLAEIGFTEIETRRETFVYGGLASVLSAYEAIRADTGELVAEGVNVLTLMRVGDDWKIASIAWRAADADWPVERAFEAVEQD